MTALTLVDLPGIVSIRTEGQPDTIVQDIEQMVNKRIRSENVLILAITPAVSDLANSKALGMANSVDPEGKRTIGVFTKLDRMEDGMNAIDLIEGSKYPLELGYVGVICRSQNEIEAGKTLEDQFIKELKFFECNSEYSKKLSYFGISVLREKLEVEFRNHLNITMPKIYEEVRKGLEHANKELSVLGNPIPEGYNCQSFFISCMNEVYNDIEGLLDGSKCSYEFTELVGGAIFRRVIIKFHQKMKRILNIMEFEKDSASIIFMNSEGLEGSRTIPQSLIKNMLRKNISSLESILIRLLDDMRKHYIDFLAQVCKNRFLVQYSAMKSFFMKRFLVIIEKNFVKCKKKLKFLIELECESLDPDSVEFRRPEDKELNTEKKVKNVEKSFLSKLEKSLQVYFLKGKESIDLNAPKYVKHYFIKKNLVDLKTEVNEFINTKGNEAKALFHEVQDVVRKRVMLTERQSTLEEVNMYLQEIKTSN